MEGGLYRSNKGFQFGCIASNKSGSKIFCRMLYGTKRNKKKILEGYYNFDNGEFVTYKWWHRNYIGIFNTHFIEDKLKYFLKLYDWI